MDSKNIPENPLNASIERARHIVRSLIVDPGNSAALFSLRLRLEKIEHLAGRQSASEVASKARECSVWAHRDIRGQSILETLEKMIDNLVVLARRIETDNHPHQ